MLENSQFGLEAHRLVAQIESLAKDPVGFELMRKLVESELGPFAQSSDSGNGRRSPFKNRREAVIAAIPKLKSQGRFTHEDVAQAIGITGKRSAINRDLVKLCEDGMIKRVKLGTGGRPNEYE